MMHLLMVEVLPASMNMQNEGGTLCHELTIRTIRTIRKQELSWPVPKVFL